MKFWTQCGDLVPKYDSNQSLLFQKLNYSLENIDVWVGLFEVNCIYYFANIFIQSMKINFKCL